MPSAYAHYRFGCEVFSRLPEELRQIVLQNRQLYDVGLHGPDILFYYRPLWNNRVKALGFAIHDRPGRDFFASARRTLRQYTDSSPSLAYLFGFICHFALDSACHDYVGQKMQQSGLSHIEIEVEFDRKLMVDDGQPPLTHPLSGHISACMRSCMVIAPFFDGTKPEQIYRALKSMKWYDRLFLAPGKGKRAAITALLRLSGRYADLHGLLVNRRPNPACTDSSQRLSQLYTEALGQAARLIAAFAEGKPLNAEYDRTFSAKRGDERTPLGQDS